MVKRRTGSAIVASIVAIVLVAAVLRVYSLMLQQQVIESEVHTIPLYPTIQGLYEDCSPSHLSFCLDRLTQMAKAGFRLVVNYEQLNGTARQELAYEDHAYLLGMRIIWDMSDPAFWNGANLLKDYSNFAATCTCSDNIGFIRYYVSLVENLPATWGYYIGDEVKKQDHNRLKAFTDLVKQLDPSHPRLFVASENESTVGSNVQPFVDTADVLGADFYPISTSDPITAVGDVSRSVQSVTNRYNKQAILVLQAFSWANYPKETWVCPHFPGCARFPTEDELRQMRDLAINNAHLQFILWYSYFDIFRSDHAASHWANLIEAARTIPVVPHLSISHPHFTKVQVLDGQLGLVTI